MNFFHETYVCHFESVVGFEHFRTFVTCFSLAEFDSNNQLSCGHILRSSNCQKYNDCNFWKKHNLNSKCRIWPISYGYNLCHIKNVTNWYLLSIWNIGDVDQVNGLPGLITWNKIIGFLYFCFDINRNCSYEKVRKLFTLVLLRSKNNLSAHLCWITKCWITKCCTTYLLMQQQMMFFINFNQITTSNN